MSFLKSIEDLRNIEWDSEHLWDIKFPEAPYPFNNWFPAIDSTDNLATIISETQVTHQSDFRYPKGSNQADLNLTFPDDENLTLVTWFKDWMNEIQGNGMYMLSLAESVRMCQVLKLTKDRRIVSYNTYYVYPEGALNFMGKSQSGIPQYTLSFVKAGTSSTTPQEESTPVPPVAKNTIEPKENNKHGTV